MITNAVHQSKSEELCGYEVKQKSIEELKSEKSILQAKMDQSLVEISQLKSENQKKEQEIERLKMIINGK